MPRLPFTLDEVLWRFDTTNMVVAFFATPEDMDPADSFEFPEDIEAVRSGSHGSAAPRGGADVLRLAVRVATKSGPLETD